MISIVTDGFWYPHLYLQPPVPSIGCPLPVMVAESLPEPAVAELRPDMGVDDQKPYVKADAAPGPSVGTDELVPQVDVNIECGG